MLKLIPFYGSLLGRPLSDKLRATHSHVLVYGAIEAHSFGPSGCVASNKTIAAETGLIIATVSKSMSQLNTAGWVKVDLDENNHRICITPLLEPATPLLPSNPPLTPQKGGPYSPVNIDNSNKVTVLDNRLVSKEVSLDTKKQKLPDPLVSRVVSTFTSKIGAMPRQQYQRRAAKTLIQQHGAERVVAAINYLQTVRGERYCPSIGNLVQLRDKWVELETFGMKQAASKQKGAGRVLAL